MAVGWRQLLNARRWRESATLMSQVSMLLNIGSAMLILPLLVTRLSGGELALWLYFSLIMALASMADIGFGNALLRATSYFFAGATELPRRDSPMAGQRLVGPNLSRLADLVGTCRRIYLGVAVAGTAATLVFGGLMARNLIRLAGDSDRHWMAFFLLVVGTGFGLLSAFWNNLSQGFGRIADVRFRDLMVGGLKLVGFAVALLAGGKVLALAGVNLAVNCAAFLLQRRLGRSCLAGIAPSLLSSWGFSPSLFRQIWPATWRQGVISIGGYFINQAGGLVIGQLRDTTVIGQYLLTLRVFGVIRSLAQVPVFVATPVFVQYRAAQDRAGLRRIFSRKVALGIGLFVVSCVGFWLAGKVAAALPGGKQWLIPDAAYLLMSVTLLLEVHHCCHSSLFVSRNEVPFVVPSLVSGGAIIALNLLLVPAWGLWAVLWIQFGVQLACNNWWPVWLVFRELEWNLGSYLRELWRQTCGFVGELLVAGPGRRPLS